MIMREIDIYDLKRMLPDEEHEKPTDEYFLTLAKYIATLPGEMKVLPIYLFFIRPIPYGIPDFSEKPNAASNPESGTPITTSASTG